MIDFSFVCAKIGGFYRLDLSKSAFDLAKSVKSIQTSCICITHKPAFKETFDASFNKRKMNKTILRNVNATMRNPEKEIFQAENRKNAR